MLFVPSWASRAMPSWTAASDAPQSNQRCCWANVKNRFFLAMAQFSRGARKMACQQPKVIGISLCMANLPSVATCGMSVANGYWVCFRHALVTLVLATIFMCTLLCYCPCFVNGTLCNDTSAIFFEKAVRMRPKARSARSILTKNGVVAAFAATLVAGSRRRWHRRWRRRWATQQPRRHHGHAALFPTCFFRSVTTYMAFVALVVWQIGWTGIRVGEATNPGPVSPLQARQGQTNLSVMYTNVTSLRRQYEAIRQMDQNIIAL